MNQIDEDAQDEINEIAKKNESNLKQVQDMGLKSKAELQLYRNKLLDVESEIEQLIRQKQDKGTQLENQKKTIDSLRAEIKERGKEIYEKDGTIADRERTIYTFKKRTQELDKFKFVLDFKIKELKREIAPQEAKIAKLKIDTNKMDKSLRLYNNTNMKLGVIVDDLRTKQEQMQELIQNNRAHIRRNDTYI